MKKFYSFLFAAVALVGFAACNSDNTEEPAPAGVEKVSFKANIDDTKTDLNGLQTIWTTEDVIMIEGYEFTTTDAVTFTCTTNGCSELLAMDKVTAVYSYNKDGKIDSEAGVAGAVLEATGNLNEGNLSFAVTSAFLKFTTTGTVTLKADKEIFSTGDTFKVTGAVTDKYVAINPLGDVKLSCESFGKEVKPETDVNLAVKKIYNLGNLEAATFTVYVTPQPKSSAADWATVNVYAWDADWKNNTWPGTSVTENTEDINGYTYYKYTFPTNENDSEDMQVIVNNGTNQTDDIPLGKLDKDYYVVYSVAMYEVYTEAPAAGTIPEYEAPATKNMLYMKDGCGWSSDNAHVYAYFWSPAQWVKMTDTDGDKIYECEIPEGVKNVIITRNSADVGDWDKVWNQTGDLTLPTDGKNMYNMSSWGSGSWTTK